MPCQCNTRLLTKIRNNSIIGSTLTSVCSIPVEQETTKMFEFEFSSAAISNKGFLAAVQKAKTIGKSYRYNNGSFEKKGSFNLPSAFDSKKTYRVSMVFTSDTALRMKGPDQDYSSSKDYVYIIDDAGELSGPTDAGQAAGLLYGFSLDQGPLYQVRGNPLLVKSHKTQTVFKTGATMGHVTNAGEVHERIVVTTQDFKTQARNFHVFNLKGTLTAMKRRRWCKGCVCLCVCVCVYVCGFF